MDPLKDPIFTAIKELERKMAEYQKQELGPQITPSDHIVDATGTLADITTKFNTLLAQLEAMGILKSS